jgi:hypothetical protein
MTLIGATAALPDAVTRTLDLPKDDSGVFLASPRAVSRSAEGLTKANLALESGRAFGLATAETARDRARAESRAADAAREMGRAFAEAAAAAAEQNREDLGHGSRPDLGGLPGDRGGPVVPVQAFLPAVPERP